MTERFFRLILGSTLILFLFMRWDYAVYGYIGFELFEGITNWRVPLLVSRLRYGSTSVRLSGTESFATTRGFDAERALRLVVAGFLIISYVLFRDALWFFPWFLGFALIMAGISGICPMAMFLKKIGFK
ncbi:MAG: DUF2892 domain-containing protein [Nitrospirae bacterium]|nr:DUF2892 domain-containing protein [Nitrospirota bacterium]